MIKTDVNVTNLKGLQEYINKVNKYINNQKLLNEYLGKKSLETLNKVISERLKSGTTNDEYIDNYKQNNILEISSDGFTIYNNTMADISEMNPETQANYPNGFSIALAFEYGVGITGENSAVNGAWEYNVNNYNWAWKYKKNGSIYSTYGYQGMEIYRYTVEEIKNNMSKWIKEYFSKEVK